MGIIERLPEDLTNQIAAGEVVERPSSVVKELVENAVDAGATRIRVDLDTGGVGLIRVTDDGSGMSPEDALCALERHATSKIRKLDDLLHIATYGFRGEALPSIASVSRFSLTTRRREDDAGTQVLVEGGAPARVRPSGAAPGTIVEVEDLFFNVPARRKFLRAPATESAHVSDVVAQAALASPLVTVELARAGRVVREWLRAENREVRVRAAYGDEPLSACKGERGPLRVEAYLSRPERARAGATGLVMLVNGRPVRDRVLARSVAQAYGSVLEAGRYPVGVVYLDLDAERLDVNVHPQKAEVRFSDGRAVAEALFRVIADDLARAFGMPVATRSWGAKAAASGPGNGPPPADPAQAWTFSRPASTERAEALAMAVAEAAVDPVISQAPSLPYPTRDTAEGRIKNPSFSQLRFVAQLRLTFLVCEGPDGLYVLDQHAAAERVTFHRLRRAFAGRDIATQALLFPVTVEVSAADCALLDEAHETFVKLGLDVRAIGPTTVAVHAVPRLLARAEPETLVRDLIAEVARSGGRAFSNAVDLVLATMACHGSIRAGDRVSPEEAAFLFAALDDVDFAGHCPHGRPIVTRVGWDELERKVGRR